MHNNNIAICTISKVHKKRAKTWFQKVDNGNAI